MKLKNYVVFFLFWIFWGCQKDDICPPGTETTPMLLIEFYDTEDPTTLKVVENLVMYASGREQDTLIKFATTNNISIPLKTNENSTEYHFISNAGTENENEDIVKFSYTPNPVYLNRACGYKINYLNLNLTIEGENDKNWIKSNFLVHQNIENETEAHIYFTH